MDHQIASQMDHYCYTPLPPSCIRLLHVHSADRRQGIACSIEIAPLEEAGIYNCLSYTWGNPFNLPDDNDDPHFLSIGSALLGITKNLFDAICHLFEGANQRLNTIWIDAVCINQSDESEKGKQVARMKEIYQGAALVLAWLGPENNTTGLVFETISIINARKKADPEYIEKLREEITLEGGEKLALDEITIDHWLACEEFFRRSFFSRMWIIQEIVVATDLMAACGTKLLSWEDIADLSHAITTISPNSAIRVWSKNQSGQRKKLLDCDNVNVAMLNGWRIVFAEVGHFNQALFQYLVLHLNRLHFRCGRAHDMIYAILGLCHKEHQIHPDYTKSAGEIYTQFSAELLQRNHRLRLLTYVEDSSYRNDMPDHLDLPSWVPDYRAEPYPTSLTMFYDSNPFGIGKYFPICGQISIQANCLRLYGYKIDIIDEISESAAEILETHGIIRLLALLNQLPPRYPTGEDRIEALWRTMAILYTDQYPAPSLVARTFQEWILHQMTHTWIGSGINRFEGGEQAWKKSHRDVLCRLVREDSTSLIPTLSHLYWYHFTLQNYYQSLGLRIRPEVGYASVEAKWPERIIPWIKSIPLIRWIIPLFLCRVIPMPLVGLSSSSFGQKALSRMRIFRTRGSWLGKGAQSMQVGDSIWVFPGADVPFILRQSGEGQGYNLVGQAYVHGLMDGERVKEILKGAKGETIKIE